MSQRDWLKSKETVMDKILSGRFLSKENSQLISQLLTDYKAHLMIGSANSALVPCSSWSWTGGIAVWSGGAIKISNEAGTNYAINLVAPLPTNRGGLKLYIDGINISVADADADDYLDQVRAFGLDFNSLVTLHTDTTNRTSANEYLYTFTAVDVSVYKQVLITINMVATDARQGDIAAVAARVYYDT